MNFKIGTLALTSVIAASCSNVMALETPEMWYENGI